MVLSNDGFLMLILGLIASSRCTAFSSPRGHDPKLSDETRSTYISKQWRRSLDIFARKIPEFTVDDEDDTGDYNNGRNKRHTYNDDFDEFQSLRKNTSANIPKTSSMKKGSGENGKRENTIETIRRPKRVKRMKASDHKSIAGTSWMEKNAKFSSRDANISIESNNVLTVGPQQSMNKNKREIRDTKTFRQDFRQTRVFVQGIPPGVSWQNLKDHFREAGNVVFASISVDTNTGESKGHGIVQFETTAMAQNAIQIMRDFPLNGSNLFVREDVQQNDNPNARLRPSSRSTRVPSKWKCANEDNAEYMSEEELTAITSLIKERDDARKRRQFDVSDRLRDDLKINHSVFIDDRLKMWWASVDGKEVPQSIKDVKGAGRWNLKPWRQIPTTPENDACINPDMVEGLLKQRDIARREKDFNTADRLLEEARTSPDGDLELRIHDESRTWRAWTESWPPAGRYEERRRTMSADPVEAKVAAAKECLEIVRENAPEKLDEIVKVLKRFPGREFQVLKRLKQQYL